MPGESLAVPPTVIAGKRLAARHDVALRDLGDVEDPPLLHDQGVGVDRADAEAGRVRRVKRVGAERQRAGRHGRRPGVGVGPVEPHRGVREVDVEAEVAGGGTRAGVTDAGVDVYSTGAGAADGQDHRRARWGERGLERDRVVGHVGVGGRTELQRRRRVVADEAAGPDADGHQPEHLRVGLAKRQRSRVGLHDDPGGDVEHSVGGECRAGRPRREGFRVGAAERHRVGEASGARHIDVAVVPAEPDLRRVVRAVRPRKRVKDEVVGGGRERARSDRKGIGGRARPVVVSIRAEAVATARRLTPAGLTRAHGPRDRGRRHRRRHDRDQADRDGNPHRSDVEPVVAAGELVSRTTPERRHDAVHDVLP